MKTCSKRKRFDTDQKEDSHLSKRQTLGRMLTTHMVSMPACKLLCKATEGFRLFPDVVSQLSSTKGIVKSGVELSNTCKDRQGHVCGSAG